MAASDPWWATAVFYQIYPRSFADGNGDGTGDLTGIRSRLDYLAGLGVDALWLSPFFRSPMADGGYDVADPCDVDPRFGTLADFDALLADAHARGIRVTIDVVPNHVSSEHPWFRAAMAAPPGSPARERFYFRPGRGEGGQAPPNNWPSVFGGPAWTRVPGEPNWYLHLFAPEQPDLNWTDPDVPAEFERIFRFWLDRGVDGFRVDVAHAMAKPEGLPDMDPAVVRRAQSGGVMPSLDDIRWDREEVHDYHRRLRRVLDAYPGERMAVGEAWVGDSSRLARYVRPDELNLTFNFELVEADWGAEVFRSAIRRSLDAMAAVRAPCTWVLANHDVHRTVTRYGNGGPPDSAGVAVGGGAVGLARARAAALVQLSLPGAVYLYNGDELGLADVDLPDDALQDPTWERSGHTDRGRDGARVPLPWSGDRPPYGFGDTAATWLPMPTGWGPLTVAAQDADPASTLNLYRRALGLRRSLPAAPLEWLDAPPGCLAYRRGDVVVMLNAGGDAVPLPVGEVLLHSAGPGAIADGGLLPPDTAAWLRSGGLPTV